jgi:hypothetical protein
MDLLVIALVIVVVIESIAIYGYDRLLRQSIRSTDLAIETAHKWREEALRTRVN